MTREEVIEYFKSLVEVRRKYGDMQTMKDEIECLDMGVKALTAISELSKSLKAVNRYDMDEKVLIGFNMAVAIFNKCFGEIGALKNEQSEQNVGMCQQNVGEMSEKQTDGDLISRQAVLDLCGTGKWLEEYRAEENGVKTRGYDTLKMINYTKLLKLPAIPQTDYENYEEFGWCKGCKEYDTEKHCCHRYSSFIRESLQDNINAVLEDIKAEMEKEQAECPYPLDIENAITIIDKYISRKE